MAAAFRCRGAVADHYGAAGAAAPEALPVTGKAQGRSGMLVQPLPSARPYHPDAARVPPSTGIV